MGVDTLADAIGPKDDAPIFKLYSELGLSPCENPRTILIHFHLIVVQDIRTHYGSVM